MSEKAMLFILIFSLRPRMRLVKAFHPFSKTLPNVVFPEPLGPMTATSPSGIPM